MCLLPSFFFPFSFFFFFLFVCPLPVCFFCCLILSFFLVFVSSFFSFFLSFYSSCILCSSFFPFASFTTEPPFPFSLFLLLFLLPFSSLSSVLFCFLLFLSDSESVWIVVFRAYWFWRARSGLLFQLLQCVLAAITSKTTKHMHASSWLKSNRQTCVTFFFFLQSQRFCVRLTEGFHVCSCAR